MNKYKALYWILTIPVFIIAGGKILHASPDWLDDWLIAAAWTWAAMTWADYLEPLKYEYEPEENKCPCPKPLVAGSPDSRHCGRCNNSL